MPIKCPGDIAPSEITSRDLFERRREFIKAAGLGSIAGAAALLSAGTAMAGTRHSAAVKSPHSTLETATSYRDITTRAIAPT